jgi:uroporphyrinogen decarboxylase
MDPCLLYATPEHVFEETVKMCKEFGRNHIANLGHGVYPDTPLEGVKAFIAAVKSISYLE